MYINNQGIAEKDRNDESFSLIRLSLLLRVLSTVILALSIFIWSQVVGFSGDDIQQLFAEDERKGILIAVLAIILPVLAVGLWLGMSWGILLWGVLGTSLLALDYMDYPINSEIQIFSVALTGLFLLYCVVVLVSFIIKKRNEKPH